MSLTITIPGAVNVTTGATAPATLTVGVGVPGATGAQGPAGQGVPTGGTAGQFLQKIDGVSYNTDWVTLNLSTYAPLASPALTGTPTAPTATTGTSSTQIATTAFVQDAVIAGSAHAETLQATVRNNTGATLAPFTVVYINGALGNNATVAKAQANAESTSAGTFAVTQASIANNADGVVISAGVLSNVDTSAYADGDKLYLSPTTAGGVTTTKPSAPNHLVYVGVVTRSHPTQGTVSVRIQNGYELGEIHDVALASVANSDLLAYDSATSLWKNKSFSTLGLLTSATAASTYYLQTNPAGYITSSALSPYLTSATAASTYAPLASPTFTGTVTIPAGASISGYATTSSLSSYAPLASPALTGTPTAPTATAGTNTTQIATTAFVLGQGFVTSSTAPVTSVAGRTGAITLAVADVSGAAPLASPTFTGTVTIPAGASITGYAALAGATFTGLVGTPASTTTTAGLNLPHGAAPTTPVNGDVWTTTSGLFARVNGGTQQYAPLGSTNTFTGTNTFSGASVSVGTSTAASTINIGTGATLTATTKAVNIGTNGVSGSTTNITIGNSVSGATSTTTVAGTLNATGTSLDLGNSTAAATYNIGNGATTTGLTKAINIGNNGAAGSTTSIVIGQATGTSSTNIYGTVTLQGSAAATTLAADTNTTGIATTAFVVGQAGSATPLVDGTAAVGTSLRYARQDHVHPTDTSRAALASPTFTGVPAAPTAAVDTNTTQIATTAYVVGQGYLKSATASTTYAPLASPTFTGVPAAPTAIANTNTTQVATTAFVLGQASSTTPVVDGTAAVGTATTFARADHVHPTDTSRAPLASPTFTGVPAAPTAAVDTNTTQLATTAYVVGQGYAKLASPTFTGTPSLPTGTIAVTQTAGNNTTAVATTAFVTAAVPAFATNAQVVAGTSATTTLAPANSGFLKADPRLRSLAFINTVALSGSGAALTSTPQQFAREMYLSSLATGRACYQFGVLNAAQAGFGTSNAVASQVDFSKKVWISGYAAMGYTGGTSYIGDANTICRISLGGYNSNTTGNMTMKGIGLKKVGGASSFVTLTVHNGTTLTDVASSVTVPDGGGIHWMIYSDGTGNVTLYINGSQAATTTAGPTTATASGAGCYIEQVEAATTPAVRQAMDCNGGWFFSE